MKIEVLYTIVEELLAHCHPNFFTPDLCKIFWGKDILENIGTNIKAGGFHRNA